VVISFMIFFVVKQVHLPKEKRNDCSLHACKRVAVFFYRINKLIREKKFKALINILFHSFNEPWQDQFKQKRRPVPNFKQLININT
jgi:hypothetical protein